MADLNRINQSIKAHL